MLRAQRLAGALLCLSACLHLACGVRTQRQRPRACLPASLLLARDLHSLQALSAERAHAGAAAVCGQLQVQLAGGRGGREGDRRYLWHRREGKRVPVSPRQRQPLERARPLCWQSFVLARKPASSTRSGEQRGCWELLTACAARAAARGPGRDAGDGRGAGGGRRPRLLHRAQEGRARVRAVLPAVRLRVQLQLPGSAPSAEPCSDTPGTVWGRCLLYDAWAVASWAFAKGCAPDLLRMAARRALQPAGHLPDQQHLLLRERVCVVRAVHRAAAAAQHAVRHLRLQRRLRDRPVHRHLQLRPLRQRAQP